MAVIKLIDSDNPILKVPLSGVSEGCDRQKLQDDLIETMKNFKGLGLSANQVGIMERVFVMYSDVMKGEIIACFNPIIITESDEEIMMDEGCLSYPGLWLKVKRPDGIEVTYEDENGEKQEKAMFGLTCRVFQHEYDHMQGLDFTKKVSKLRLNMAKKRQIKQMTKIGRSPLKKANNFKDLA